MALILAELSVADLCLSRILREAFDSLILKQNAVAQRLGQTGR